MRVILQNLNKEDIASMKCLSKDERYNDMIDKKLKEIREDKERVTTVTKYIKCIKKRLDKCERLRSLETKLKLVNDIYEHVCENGWFIKRLNGFNEVIHNKLFQLISDHPPFKANGLKYLERLYDLKQPKECYDSQMGRLRYGMFDKNGRFVDMGR